MKMKTQNQSEISSWLGKYHTIHFEMQRILKHTLNIESLIRPYAHTNTPNSFIHICIYAYAYASACACARASALEILYQYLAEHA